MGTFRKRSITEKIKAFVWENVLELWIGFLVLSIVMLFVFGG